MERPHLGGEAGDARLPAGTLSGMKHCGTATNQTINSAFLVEKHTQKIKSQPLLIQLLISSDPQLFVD